MPAMRLRTATADDADPIADLHARSWQQTYAGMLSDDYLAHDVFEERRDLWRTRLAAPEPHWWTIVLEDDDGLAGFAHAVADDDPTFGSLLNNLHVAERRRGEGHGVRLLAETAAWVEADAAAPLLYLWVAAANTAARDFYARLGGVEVEEGVWETAPGGAKPPTHRVAWTDLAPLLRRRQPDADAAR